jgi:hypothetical protein
VILGCASPSPDEVNIGRVVALRLGCGHKVPAWTVMRNCASGMQALDSAIANIQNGRSQLVLAGGVDALSHAALLYSEAMVRWFAQMMQARTLSEKAAVFAKLRPAQLLSPVIGSAEGADRPEHWSADGADGGKPCLALRDLASARWIEFSVAQPPARRCRPCRRAPWRDRSAG